METTVLDPAADRGLSLTFVCALVGAYAGAQALTWLGFTGKVTE